MLTTSAPSVHRSFTVVDYAVLENGQLHIGKTIKKFLVANRYSYQWLADEIFITKSGVSELLRKPTIQTERLHQISRSTGHDFFKYFSLELGEGVVSEEQAAYHKPKRKKIVLEIENDEVVNQKVMEEDQMMQEIELKKSLIDIRDMQKMMWEIMQQSIPDIAAKIADREGGNPLNSDNDKMQKKD